MCKQFNIIVGQSGGPTAVINSSLAGVYSAAKKSGVNIVYGMKYGISGLFNRDIINLNNYILNDNDVELLKQTPSSYLGSCRYKLKDFNEDDSEYVKIFEILEEYNIKYFFYIGGNDSMDTINKLYKYAEKINSDIKFIGVPKTIDNDLIGTDHTPGYGSAAKYIATVVKEIIRDSMVYNIKSVTIVEVMGRNTGWLTAASMMAGGYDCEGPDLIYVPEVVFDKDKFILRVGNILSKKNNVIVIVSEGVKTEDGKYVCELCPSNTDEVDSFGHSALSGAANALAGIVRERFSGCKVRSIELNILQRCAAHIHSATDVSEAFMVGEYAFMSAQEGYSGFMVTLRREESNEYKCVCEKKKIDEVANIEKILPQNFISGSGDYISDDFVEYVKPLIYGRYEQLFDFSIPIHFKI